MTYAPFAKALVDQLTYNDAYDEGRDAFDEGESEQDNPYDGELGKAWQNGWSDARNEQA